MIEKQIRRSKKCADAKAVVRVTFAITMKFCPNQQCVAHGRVVYSPATRCVLCRWDLKPPRMLSETVDAASLKSELSGQMGMPTQASAQHRRSTLRHSA